MMMHFTQSAAIALAVLYGLAQVQANDVFAHFMVGNVAAYSIDDWVDDIAKAKDAGIDGFALNIGPQDDYTTTQITLAAGAANQVQDFTLFLSFDYLTAGVPWDAGVVTSTIKDFASKAGAAQYRYQNKPLVSTFEGADSAADWAAIKADTDCFFVPDWTSRSPGGIPQENIDGAFSWDAWPHGPVGKDKTSDVAWQAALSGKPYMMGISPWFYTSLPQYGKNWGLRGDDLWSTRWQQAVELQPAFVEIITWNDYGESHYIGPIKAAGIPQGAERYVRANSHEAWRNLLPYYISTYKNGVAPPVTEEKVVYYHKPNPSNSCSDGGTVGNQPGDTQYTIQEVSLDQVSVDILISQPADVIVQIGDYDPTVEQAKDAGLNHFAVPFDGRTGKVTVTVSRDGQSVVSATGTEISTNCEDGLVNWNAVVAGSS